MPRSAPRWASRPGPPARLIFRARNALRDGIGSLVPMPLLRHLAESGDGGGGAVATATGGGAIVAKVAIAIVATGAVGDGRRGRSTTRVATRPAQRTPRSPARRATDAVPLSDSGQLAKSAGVAREIADRHGHHGANHPERLSPPWEPRQSAWLGGRRLQPHPSQAGTAGTVVPPATTAPTRAAAPASGAARGPKMRASQATEDTSAALPMVVAARDPALDRPARARIAKAVEAAMTVSRAMPPVNRRVAKANRIPAGRVILAAAAGSRKRRINQSKEDG